MDKEILSEICDWINFDRTLDVFKRVADTPGPSQVAPWTRGKVIKEILTEFESVNKNNLNWDNNFKNTHNGVIRLGEKVPEVGLVSHWDTISYLIGDEIKDGYELIPYFDHIMEPRAENGLCLGYNLISKKYEIICHGKIVGGETPKFLPNNNEKLKPGHRVVFNSPAKSTNIDSVYEAQIDNAAGCTAVLLATIYLSGFSGVNLISCFTDEEEGPVAKGNSAFSRGSFRLLPHIDDLNLVFISDLHGMPDEETANKYMGKGALITEYASKTRGAVTPPWLFEVVSGISNKYNPDIKTQISSKSFASRSDCIAFYQKNINIVLAGVPSINRHYLNGIPKCSIDDIMNLSRFLVVSVLSYHNNSSAFETNINNQDSLI